MAGEAFTGLTAAVFTPMHRDGSLWLERIPALVDHLERSGVVGVFVCGSTGEGMSLSREERASVAEAYVDACSGRLRVTVQVGHDCHAECLACCEAVASAARATPFYYYHIPALTGVEIDVSELLRRSRSTIQQFAGVKLSHADLAEAQRCLRTPGGFEVLYGCDESLLGALTLGVHGAVGSTYNFAAPLYLEMAEAFRAGDIDAARLCQSRATAMIDAIVQTCGRAGMKAVMGMIGLDCGPARLPLGEPARGKVEELRQRLEVMGFFSWVRGVEGTAALPRQLEHRSCG
jgi:N-acetylneuraminate lyase